MMNADLKFPEQAFGALLTDWAVAASGRMVIGVETAPSFVHFCIGLAGEAFALRAVVALVAQIGGKLVVVIKAVGLAIVFLQGGDGDGAVGFASVVLGAIAIAGVCENFERSVNGQFEIGFDLLGDGVEQVMVGRFLGDFDCGDQVVLCINSGLNIVANRGFAAFAQLAGIEIGEIDLARWGFPRNGLGRRPAGLCVL